MKRMALPLSVTLALLGLSACTQARTVSDPGPGIAPDLVRVGTMSELMIHLIYPTSDAVFYITTRTPTTEAEWGVLEAQTLILAESANLIMAPGRRWDDAQWMEDAELMRAAGQAAFEAAKARDLEALDALNGPLYDSCVTCHEHYRPDYGRRN